MQYLSQFSNIFQILRLEIFFGKAQNQTSLNGALE
jgi:hypothetical protein